MVEFSEVKKEKENGTRFNMDPPNQREIPQENACPLYQNTKYNELHSFSLEKLRETERNGKLEYCKAAK